MSKYISILVLMFTFSISKSQNPIHFSISNSSLAATDSVLPFWFTANQHGKIKPSNSFLNITDLFAGQVYKINPDSKVGYTWGANVIAAFGKTNYYQINQAFAGVSYNGWELKGGRFYDEINYAGLSATNGNLTRSQNTEPVPTIRFSTLGYKPLPFAKKWLSFKGEYDEGFLNDNRYVQGAHLHHKSLYLKFIPKVSWNFSVGFEHYVMWGGTSQDENIGDLPEGFDDYWRYVFALPGNEDFLITDQLNISGNQLGTYQLQVEKEFVKFKTTFYLSHPFEDNSGLNWHNWPDNLLGIYIHLKNDKKLITDFIYEFTNTRQQSITDSIYYYDKNSGKWKMKEFDNYYNNGVYRSGFTYNQQVMSSPLFFPLKLSNDISLGIRSNRLFAHHIGARGKFSEFFSWKGMLTYIQHLGTWSEQYDSHESQVSGLFEIRFINPAFPFEMGFATGADFGNFNGKNAGFNFSITKNW